ncbi:CAP domain-containing protein [Hutsoniella sourekii]
MKSHYRLAFVLAAMTVAGVSYEDLMVQASEGEISDAITVEQPIMEGAPDEAGQPLENTSPNNDSQATSEETAQPADPIEENKESEPTISPQPTGSDNSTVGVTSPSTSQENKSITLEELETELGVAVKDSVNELRRLNNLPSLEIDDSLQVAAKKLVNKEPTSPAFIKEYKNPHALDGKLAREENFKQLDVNNQEILASANHLKTSVKTIDLKNKSFRQLADDLVNRWFLDISDPMFSHRKQLLVKDWNLTGIGLKLTPTTLIGDYHNDGLKDDQGHTIRQIMDLDLYDGFDIHLTQYYGSDQKISSTEGPIYGTTLASFRDFVKAQVGQSETNPVTNQEVEFKEEQAKIILDGLSEYLNDKNDNKFNSQPKGQYSWQELARALRDYHFPDNNDYLNESLKAEIHRLFVKENGEDHDFQPGSFNELTIKRNDQKALKFLVSYEQDKFNYIEIPLESTGDINDQFARVRQNVFKDKDSAELYGRAIVSIQGSDDYYYDIFPTNHSNQTLYTVWFSKKRDLDETSKEYIERWLINPFIYGVTSEEDRQRFNQYRNHLLNKIRGLKYEEDVNGHIRILEGTPLIKENLDYNWHSDSGRDKFISKDGSSHAPYRDLAYTTPFLGEGPSYLIDVYKRENTPNLYGEKNLAEMELKRLLSDYSQLPDYAKYEQAENLFSDTVLKNIKTPDDYLALFTGRIERQAHMAGNPYYAYVYPKYWDHFKESYSEDFTRGKWATEEDKLLIADLPEGIDIKDHSYRDKEGTLRGQVFFDPNQVFFPKEFRFKQIKERLDAEPGATAIQVTKDEVKYKDNLSLKLGNFYLTMKNDDKLSKKAANYSQLEDAIAAGEAYVEGNPGWYYDIIKFGDKYLLSYGENRLESRWNPDNFHFTSYQVANEFADYIKEQPNVAIYEYDIVPLKQGYSNIAFQIQTKNIEYIDDSKRLLFVPEVLNSDNAGVGGQNIESKGNLADIYKEFQKNGQTSVEAEEVKPEEAIPEEKPGETEKEVKPKEETNHTPTWPNSKTNWEWEPLTKTTSSKRRVIAQGSQDREGLSTQQNHFASADQSVNYHISPTASSTKLPGQLYLELSDKVFSQLVTHLIQDYLQAQGDFSQDLAKRFAYLFEVQLVFKDVSQETLSEPARAELVLKEGEEVDQVVRYDVDQDEILETLDFQVEETRDEAGRLIKILSFEVTASGYYGVVLK